MALVACLLLFGGCTSSDVRTDKPQPTAPSATSRSESQRGPVRIIAAILPSPARLSDELKLTLRVEAADGVKVQLPEFGQSIGDFTVLDHREPLPRVEGNREILERIYTLEPPRTGKLSINPIRVTFTDTRRDGDRQQHLVETEPLTVEITSVVPSGEPSLAELRPLAGPVELPAERAMSLWWLLLPLAAALAVFGWLCRKRRKSTADEKPLSPQELARLELEQLLAEGLAERDVKLFYVALTGLVRRYIERTTGVRAPEQTTGEFLREIAGQKTFPPDETRRLQQFLESADLVKFAAYQPRMEDVDESMERARRFIGLERMEVTA